MKHSRRDYNNLKALDLKIPDNEPVFLLRAQDITAVETVEYWASLQKDSYLKEIALRHARLMRSWPVKKWADCPDSEIPEDIQMELGIGTSAALAEIEEELEANLVQAETEEGQEEIFSMGLNEQSEDSEDEEVINPITIDEEEFDDDEEDEEDEEFEDEDNVNEEENEDNEN